MLNREELFKGNSINKQTVIPDIDICPPLAITQFEIDEDREKYNELTVDNDGDVPCFMEMKDSIGNIVQAELNIIYDENLEVSKFRMGIRAFDKNEEEQYAEIEDATEIDFSDMTPDEVSSLLTTIITEHFEQEYQRGNFKKPDIVLQDILEYVDSEYAASDRGDDIFLPDFPEKGILTYIQKDFVADNIYDVYFNNAKDYAVIASKSDCIYNELSDTIVNIACGEFKCDNGKTIKEVLDMTAELIIDENWVKNNYHGEKEFIIPEGAAEIGNASFNYCKSLAAVTIPDSVTKIGNAFCGCEALKSVNIPDSVMVIGDGAFEECVSLRSVSLPKNITEISNSMFSGCGSLSSIAIPDNVTVIGDWAFEGCESLLSVTMPDNVNRIGDGAFARCSKLFTVSISNSIEEIGEGAFEECESLDSIVIPDGTSRIGDTAFYGCDSLESVTIPDSVTEIGEKAFYACNIELKIICNEGSYAEKYAAENNISCEYAEKQIDYER